MGRIVLPDLELKEGDLFGAALLTPAFSSDLSTWRVTINRNGLLKQTVLIGQPPEYKRQIATLHQHVSQDKLEDLKKIAEEENVIALNDFPYHGITDCQGTQLILRLHGQTNVIFAYAPHAAAKLGESEADKSKAARYCRLWDAIEELTPFTPYQD